MGSIVANTLAGSIPKRLSNIVGWTVCGAVVGLAQWPLLRRELKAARWWVLASAVEWLLGTRLFVYGGGILWALGELVSGNHNHRLSWENGASAGAGIGFVQWILVRRELTGAGWWVSATILGWSLFYIPAETNLYLILDAMILGILTGSLTSVVLVWRLRHDRVRIKIQTVDQALLVQESTDASPLLKPMPHERPDGVIILVVLGFLGAISAFIVGIQSMWNWEGSASTQKFIVVCLYPILALLTVWISIGLWRLRNWARLLSIALYGFNLIGSFFDLAVPRGSEEPLRFLGAFTKIV